MAGPSRIDELRKKFDENPRRYFAPLANEYRKLGDYEQAIFICQEFLPQQPGHMSGHIVYGQALFEAGRHDEARTVFETALSLDPENLIALRHLGDIARAHGDIETARAWYRRVLDSDPRNEEIAAILQALDSDPTGAVLGAAATASGAEPSSGAVESQTGPQAGAPPSVETPASTSSSALESLVEPASPPSERPAFSPLAGLTNSTDALSTPGSFEQEADLDSLFPTAAGGAGGNMYQDAPPLEAPAGPIVEPSLLDTPSPAPAAAAFVTETMAELYLQQGHREEAVGVYRQLVELHPEDSSLRGRLQSLEHAEIPKPAPPPAPEPSVEEGPTIRDFLVALAQCRPRSRGASAAEVPVVSPPVVEARSDAEPRTSRAAEMRPPAAASGTVGGSLDALFAGAEPSTSDTTRSPLEVAFSAEPAELAERPRADDSGATIRGRPATPAATELSLDHVFRHATPTSGGQAQGGFSFDQFFSRQAQDDAANAAQEPAREGEGGESDDIQQFNAWLEGLKKS